MYKQLEEENKKLKKECEENDYLVEDNARWMKKCEEKTMEIKKLKSDLEQFSEAYKRYRDFEKEELAESCYDLEKENKKLREDVDYFRQCYLDLKKLCEKEWFMLSDEEVTKMFNLDKIK